MACSAVSAPDPPTSSKVAATKPSNVHQNTRCEAGALVLPPAVMLVFRRNEVPALPKILTLH